MNNNFITPNQIQTILNNYYKTTSNNQYDVKHVEFKSLTNQVHGMMAEYYKLIIQVKSESESESESEEEQFFCKKLTMFHKIQEIMAREQGAYEKEEYIYNFLRKQFQQYNFAPECYLSVENHVLVLEDLTNSGYKIKFPGHDFKHGKITLATLAQFHATTVLYEHNQNILLGTNSFRLYDSNPDVFKDSLYRDNKEYLGSHWFQNCINTLLKLIDYSSIEKPNDLKTKLLTFTKKIYEIIKPSTIYRNVACHGDLSHLNILFKYNEANDPIHCKLVDFQALRYNPPAHDVINYIYLTTSTKIRKEYEQELLRFYFDCFDSELKKYMKENYCEYFRFNEFQKSCEYVRPHAIIQTACYATMIPLTNYPNIEREQLLYKKYVYEDRSSECVKVYQMGGQFKHIIDDMFNELNALEM